MEVPFFNNLLGIDLERMEASATSNKFGWFCCDTSPRKKNKHWVFRRPKVDLGLKTLTSCSMYTLEFGFSSYFLQGLSPPSLFVGWLQIFVFNFLNIFFNLKKNLP
jgi:hypothetical protein